MLSVLGSSRSDSYIYRYMKTIERAHTPKNLWEKVELSENKNEAISQIEKNLQYWPKFLISKNKKRLLRIRQYLKKMRKLRQRVQFAIHSVFSL